MDYLPRTPILMQYAAEHIGSDYAAFASDYRVLVRANEASAREFGFDRLSCISDPYRETQGFGSEVEYMTDGPPRSTHPLERTKDLSVLTRPDAATSERMRDRIAAVEAYSERHRGAYSILGWIEGPAAEAAALRGMTAFLMDMMDDEVYACELMDPVAVVKDGTPEAIRNAAAAAYEHVGNPFIVSAGCEIPAATPQENLAALCQPIDYRT